MKNINKSAKTYVLEGLGMDVARISVHRWSSRGSRCRLGDNTFMLNGSWTHYSINSSVCHGTASPKGHA
jgi:hypothetical protein